MKDTPHQFRQADPLVWRLVRKVLVSQMRAALRKVLSTREITINRQVCRLSRADVDRLSADLETEAANLRPHSELRSLPKLGNRLMVEFAVYTAAAGILFRRAGLDDTEARRVLADTGWVIYSRMLRLASLPAHISTRDPAKRLQRTIRLLLRFPFSASAAPGYAVLVTQTADGIKTQFTHCPPQSAARRIADAIGDPDVMRDFRASWCQYDWPGADLIAGDGCGGHYTRPRTLSAGDTVCDMCWSGTSTCTINAQKRKK